MRFTEEELNKMSEMILADLSNVGSAIEAGVEHTREIVERYPELSRDEQELVSEMVAPITLFGMVMDMIGVEADLVALDIPNNIFEAVMGMVHDITEHMRESVAQKRSKMN